MCVADPPIEALLRTWAPASRSGLPDIMDPAAKTCGPLALPQWQPTRVETNEYIP
ncbi:unnamed protein product [marine sediment metagenome]|uniref:Uncharacterized protein n=1 Tax=marine sediment metagenome TaxID=412755 RepID=X1IVJ7_9ZZZZ